MLKTIYSVLTIAALSLLSCTKHAASGNIDGVWELRSASGMIHITYPPGNGHLLKFSGSSYELYNHDTLSNSGSYRLVEDSTAEKEVCLQLPPGQFKQRIELDGINQPKTFIEVRKDTLKLVSGCFAYDAGSLRVFIRKSQAAR